MKILLICTPQEEERQILTSSTNKNKNKNKNKKNTPYKAHILKTIRQSGLLYTVVINVLPF